MSEQFDKNDEIDWSFPARLRRMGAVFGDSLNTEAAAHIEHLERQLTDMTNQRNTLRDAAPSAEARGAACDRIGEAESAPLNAEKRTEADEANDRWRHECATPAPSSKTPTLYDEWQHLNAVLGESEIREHLAQAEEHVRNHPDDINTSMGRRSRVLLALASRSTVSATLPTPCAASGIYVASRVKQAEVWKAYRAKGWKINATWIDEAGDGETADFGDLWERIRGEIARSHCLVFYAAGVEDFPFKGALVEVGMALAMNKPILVALENVMLDGRTLRPVGSWLLDRKVIRCDTLDEAMDMARGVDILCKSGTPDGGSAT